ncbi:MAG TPA: signal peptidase I [Pseudonocardiaceae bacterium]|nr:signal peptidase I [Pseudonocardiaceae bacterium]
MTASEDERADVTDTAAEGWPVEQPPDGKAADDGKEKPVEDKDKPAKPKKKPSFWKELPILIGIALVLTFLIQTFVARVYVIPSESMEQTLNGCTGCTGDRILVDKLTYDFTNISPGDVIVFKGPPGWSESEYNVDESNNVVIRWARQFGSSIGIGSPPEYDLVKRVIAVGGQTVQCCDSQNRVLVDGKPLNEPYIYWIPGEPHRQAPFAPVTVPKGDLWVMGDNRNNSSDSRFQAGGGLKGVVPESDVIGIARVIIWPPGRWGGIGETNPQTQAHALPALDIPVNVPPVGVGTLAAFPTLWLGKRARRRLLSRATRPRDGERR